MALFPNMYRGHLQPCFSNDVYQTSKSGQVLPSVGDAEKTFMVIGHINEGDEAPGGIFILRGTMDKPGNSLGRDVDDGRWLGKSCKFINFDVIS